MIREATLVDAARVAELAARTFRDTFAADNDAANLALHLESAYGVSQQSRELADPNITTLVVEVGSELIGYAQLRRGAVPSCVQGTAPLELWRFYVAREWHGRAIAPQLMSHVELMATRAGARTLWLGVWERNERAKAFYRKYDFVDVGSHVFKFGNEEQTDRIWARSL